MSLISNHCKSEWFNTIAESLDTPGISVHGHHLPEFPENQIQENTTGASGKLTLCEANIFYEDCMDIFAQFSEEDFSQKSLLDFGTGWGRILRFFMKDFSPEALIGVDIDESLLDICRDTFDWGQFIKSKASPPIDLQDNSVDYIVGYSVFSHLSEVASLEWLQEFHRILRPGGMVAVTTRGKWFLDYCASLKDNENAPPYHIALANMFDDFEEIKKQYDNGMFIHANSKGINGGAALDASFYGETWIPEQYAKAKYSDLFIVHDFVFKEGRSTHPIMVFQKK